MSDGLFEAGLDLVRGGRTGSCGRWRPDPLDAPAPCGPEPDGGSPVEARPLLFDEDQLARALAAACARQRRELEAAFAAGEERRLAAAVAAVHAGLARAVEGLAGALEESRGALCAILESALRRAVPTLLERFEEAEVRRVLDDWSRRVLPGETLTVRVRPQVRDALAAAPPQGARDARMEFVADPDLPPGGVVLELPDGLARHDPARLVEDLAAALYALVEASPGAADSASREPNREEP